MNKFAQEELEQSLIDNEKTRKYPELILLHKRWSELLNDDNTICIISEQNFHNIYEYIFNIKYKNNLYQLYRSKINTNIYIIGKFTLENEYDENKKRFQCVWNNIFL